MRKNPAPLESKQDGLKFEEAVISWLNLSPAHSRVLFEYCPPHFSAPQYAPAATEFDLFIPSSEEKDLAAVTSLISDPWSPHPAWLAPWCVCPI